MAASWSFAKTRRSWAEIRWSLINIVTALVILASINVVSSWTWAAYPGRAELGLSVICVGRTIADYSLSWRFYFPKR